VTVSTVQVASFTIQVTTSVVKVVTSTVQALTCGIQVTTSTVQALTSRVQVLTFIVFQKKAAFSKKKCRFRKKTCVFEIEINFAETVFSDFGIYNSCYRKKNRRVNLHLTYLYLGLVCFCGKNTDYRQIAFPLSLLSGKNNFNKGIFNEEVLYKFIRSNFACGLVRFQL
jgi:hypothetical protein